MSSLFIIDKRNNLSLFCVYSKTRFCLFNLPDDNWVGVSVGTEVDKDEGIEEIEVDLSVVEVTVELDIIVEAIVDLGDVIDETVEDEDVGICDDKDEDALVYVEVRVVDVTGKEGTLCLHCSKLMIRITYHYSVYNTKLLFVCSIYLMTNE